MARGVSFERHQSAAVGRWHRGHEDRLAFREYGGAGRGCGIPGTETVVFLLAIQEALGVRSGHPLPFLGDADGDDIEFAFIDCLDDGGGRKQRDLMLSTSATK